MGIHGRKYTSCRLGKKSQHHSQNHRICHLIEIHVHGSEHYSSYDYSRQSAAISVASHYDASVGKLLHDSRSDRHEKC